MARYFFHLTEDDRILADEEGMVLSDDSTAWTEAVRQIRSIVAQETRETGHIWLTRHIDVVNRRGAVVARVAFGDALRIHTE